MLIGSGYNAYVVHGIAPKFITTRDESKMDAPFELNLQDNESDDDPEIDSDEEFMTNKVVDNIKPITDFTVDKVVDPVSAYDTEQENKKKDKEKH